MNATPEQHDEAARIYGPMIDRMNGEDAKCVLRNLIAPACECSHEECAQAVFRQIRAYTPIVSDPHDLQRIDTPCRRVTGVTSAGRDPSTAVSEGRDSGHLRAENG